MPSMIYPPIDDLLEKVDNKYILAALVAKRSRQLYENDEKLINDEHPNLVTIAINEIHLDKVGYIDPEELKRKKQVVNLNSSL